MPTNATPEDLFDILSWISRPKLAKATVQTTKFGPVTFVLRANDIDDWDAAKDEAQEVPAHRRGDRHTEAIIRRCIVAMVPGSEVDLDKVPVGNLELTAEYVRAVRKDIKAQWGDLVDALNEAATAKEPDPS